VDGFGVSDFGGFQLEVTCGSVTAEVCNNGIDDDGDGAIDCLDSNCATATVCNPAELCTNGLDDDNDGAVDCADGDCATDPGCITEVCVGGVDDDGDGDTDCADTECFSDPACTGIESCTNGVDDDGDGVVDCDDTDCFQDLACPGVACSVVSTLSCDTPVTGTTVGQTNEIPQLSCLNAAMPGPDQVYAFVIPGQGAFGIELTSTSGADLDVALLFNQGGGCDPSACGALSSTTGNPETLAFGGQANEVFYFVVDSALGASDAFTIEVQCATVTAEDCGNGLDDDGDGLADCLDPNCATDVGCLPTEICTNGLDDDGDFDIDCVDADCSTDPACVVEICNNGNDDDADGDVDCADTDCTQSVFCAVELCANGLDDDLDGDTDCADVDCTLSPSCGAPAQEVCTNGVDDDGDLYVDCADAGCESDPTCAQEDCGDGFDNDGDGLVDCADSNCGADQSCITGTCALGTPIACGGSVTNTTAGASNTDYYACGPGISQFGPEDVYVFTSVTGEFLEIALTHTNSANLDLTVLENTTTTCDPASCLAASTVYQSPESLIVGTVAGSTYHIIVDGPASYDADTYTLDVGCDPVTVTFEECTNGLDDDGDGDVDCADADCAIFPTCIPPETCNDGLDNDFDAGIDCGDLDCSTATNCKQESCANGLDDDGDGAIDCVDIDCFVDPACP
jgi:hypothetical protein